MMYAGGSDNNVPFITKFSHWMKHLKCMKERTLEGGHEGIKVTRIVSDNWLDEKRLRVSHLLLKHLVIKK